MGNEAPLDILVVGAGFSGIYQLYNLRRRGFSVKVFETGSYLGGTWYWNRYPGARVDCEHPIYQFSEVGLLDFSWNERFPAHAELRQYFQYLDEKWELSKDIQFNTRVTAAQFHNTRNQWEVETEDGSITWAKHVILCTGSTTNRYVPQFKGLENFQGECYHSYVWPKTEVDFPGKRVAVIGTGATGVQIIQEIGPMVEHLTVYQRTPNLALPIENAKADDPSKTKYFPPKSEYPAIFKTGRKTFAGMPFDFIDTKATEATPEERRKFYESLYAKGSFYFWLGNYQDTLFSKEANAFAYEFWAEKTRLRIHDPVKRNLLAPLEAPHDFGIKRPSLESTYFEIFNQTNVDLISVKESPILEITEKGVRTEKEGVVEVDILILATGFDSLTGSIKSINIRNGSGESLRDQWEANGTSTYLGLATAGFPNLWYMYGPQAPTPFGNGTTMIEIQGEWLVELMVRMREQGKDFLEAKKEAEVDWCQEVVDAWGVTLLPNAESWYQGANIPGKAKEPLCYSGGIPKYSKILEEVADANFSTFTLA